jgi:hypothetical protein
MVVKVAEICHGMQADEIVCNALEPGLVHIALP